MLVETVWKNQRMMVASMVLQSRSYGMARRSMVSSMWPRRSYSRKRRPKYIFHAKKLAAVWESLIGTCSRTGTSWLTVMEGPTKGLELPDHEKLKGLEGPELEKSAMVGGSEAAEAPKGGSVARVWEEPAAARLVLGLGSIFRLIPCREIMGDCTSNRAECHVYIYRRHTDYKPWCIRNLPRKPIQIRISQ
jgi:hypothetical protein